MDLYVTDNKMLEALDILIRDGKERYKSDICENINIQPQTVRNIRLGLQHFSGEHIRLMAKNYNVNPNFLLGLDTRFYGKKRYNKNVNKGLKSA